MSSSHLRCHRYGFAEKKLALEAYFTDRYAGSGVPLKQFSKVCGINYWTILNWAQAIGWDRSRIGELQEDRRAKAEDFATGLPDAVQQQVLEIKTRNPSWGPLKIKQYLFRHEQVLVPTTSIYRFLKGQGLVKERPGAAEEVKHGRSFEYPYPLAGVQMDALNVTLSGGVAIFLVTLLDDFSRFVLTTQFVAVKTMAAVMGVFGESVRVHGPMERLLTDLGSEFVSWQRFTAFEELLVALGVEHIASGPEKPWNQGKIEHWHETVRQALRERGPLDHSSEAQLWIRQMADMYNYERPHQALGGLVPADRFNGMHGELTAELAQYAAGRRAGQRLYFVCRVGERRIVVSGPRADALSVLVDGVRVSGDPEAGAGACAAASAAVPSGTQFDQPLPPAGPPDRLEEAVRSARAAVRTGQLEEKHTPPGPGPLAAAAGDGTIDNRPGA